MTLIGLRQEARIVKGSEIQYQCDNMTVLEGDDKEICVSVWEPLFGWGVEATCVPTEAAKWAMLAEPFWWLIVIPLSYYLRRRYKRRKEKKRALQAEKDKEWPK